MVQRITGDDRKGRPYAQCVPYAFLAKAEVMVMEKRMDINLVDERSFPTALELYTHSWRESHRNLCTAEFLLRRDYAGYLRNKLGSLYLISDGEPVGVFCWCGESFGDLYIHPNFQGRGYGTACVQFAKAQAKVLRLTVLSSNQTAIALYEKTGFCFTGHDLPLREGLWEREMRYTEL